MRGIFELFCTTFTFLASRPGRGWERMSLTRVNRCKSRIESGLVQYELLTVCHPGQGSVIVPSGRLVHSLMSLLMLQHVDEENSYLCGYLKIKGLTEEFPTLTTFFDGEIISKKYPFLTRKWDADEDVDKKHWVCTYPLMTIVILGLSSTCTHLVYFRCRVSLSHSVNTPRRSIPTRSITRHWREQTLYLWGGRNIF